MIGYVQIANCIIINIPICPISRKKKLFFKIEIYVYLIIIFWYRSKSVLCTPVLGYNHGWWFSIPYWVMLNDLRIRLRLLVLDNNNSIMLWFQNTGVPCSQWFYMHVCLKILINIHIFIYINLILIKFYTFQKRKRLWSGSVGRPQTRWGDDLRKTSDRS